MSPRGGGRGSAGHCPGGIGLWRDIAVRSMTDGFSRCTEACISCFLPLESCSISCILDAAFIYVCIAIAAVLLQIGQCITPEVIFFPCPLVWPFLGHSLMLLVRWYTHSLSSRSVPRHGPSLPMAFLAPLLFPPWPPWLPWPPLVPPWLPWPPLTSPGPLAHPGPSWHPLASPGLP